MTFLDVFTHDQIQGTHEESADSPRMHNEPGSSSHDKTPITVDALDHAVIPGDVEVPSGEFEVGEDDENPSVEPQLQSHQSSEPQLLLPRRRITIQQFERNVRARQSTSSLSPVPSSEAIMKCELQSVRVRQHEGLVREW